MTMYYKLLWLPVNPKRNQPWIFIGRTDAEAEAPVFWPPDGKNWRLRKDPVAGKDWRQEEKGTTVDEMVGWHRQLNGHEFKQALGIGDGQGSSRGAVHGVAKNQTELNWTEMFFTKENAKRICFLVLSVTNESYIMVAKSSW